MALLLACSGGGDASGGAGAELHNAIARASLTLFCAGLHVKAARVVRHLGAESAQLNHLRTELLTPHWTYTGPVLDPWRPWQDTS